MKVLVFYPHANKLFAGGFRQKVTYFEKLGQVFLCLKFNSFRKIFLQIIMLFLSVLNTKSLILNIAVAMKVLLLLIYSII